MKKFKTLLTLSVAALTLAGCGGDKHTHNFGDAWKTDASNHWHECECGEKADEGAHVDADQNGKCDVCNAPFGEAVKVKNVTGGTADEQAAIQSAYAKKLVLLSGGGAMLPENITDLNGDVNDYIKVTRSQKVKVGKTNYTVDVEWEIDKSSPHFFKEVNPDDTHTNFYFNFPDQKQPDGEVIVKMKKISCGGASSVDPKLEWKCNLKAITYWHKDVKIADLNKIVSIGEGAYGYDVVDYVTEPKNAYYKKHEQNKGLEKEYYYVNAFAKVLYTAPDGDWGLINDGDQIMEIFSGNGAATCKPEAFPSLTKGNYVKVVGNMGQYNGNIQLAFITDVRDATAADLDHPNDDPDYIATTADDVAAISREDGTHYQCVYGANLSNSLRKFTGTYVEGSLKDSSGAAVTVDKVKCSARFTFQMKIGTSGGKERLVRIAYDYHTDKSGTLGIYDNLIKVLDGKEHTVGGTLRFTGNNSNPFNQTGGEWQLAPFEADAIK